MNQQFEDLEMAIERMIQAFNDLKRENIILEKKNQGLLEENKTLHGAKKTMDIHIASLIKEKNQLLLKKNEVSERIGVLIGKLDGGAEKLPAPISEAQKVVKALEVDQLEKVSRDNFQKAPISSGESNLPQSGRIY